MSIEVQAAGDGRTFHVSVDGRTPTEHKVKVDPAYSKELTGGTIETAELVRRAFEFLLAREPNTSILRTFDLPVIARYFPEFERVMKEG